LPVFAQGIFNQKGEMIKKNSKQIALLATYSSYVKKGYRIMEAGWHTVHEWKNSEFDLHVTYIHSLKKVNPKIKGEQAEAIRELAESLLSGCNKLKNVAIRSEFLSKQEVNYVKSMLKGYTRENLENINELNLVLADEKLSMTDDERLKQIARLY